MNFNANKYATDDCQNKDESIQLKQWCWNWKTSNIPLQTLSDEIQPSWIWECECWVCL